MWRNRTLTFFDFPVLRKSCEALERACDRIESNGLPRTSEKKVKQLIHLGSNHHEKQGKRIRTSFSFYSSRKDTEPLFGYDLSSLSYFEIQRSSSKRAPIIQVNLILKRNKTVTKTN